VLGKKYGCQVM